MKKNEQKNIQNLYDHLILLPYWIVVEKNNEEELFEIKKKYGIKDFCRSCKKHDCNCNGRIIKKWVKIQK